MFIKKMIEAGQVKVNGRQEKVKYKVAAGDHIEADINEEAFAPKDIPAEKMDLDVFYEDEDLVVINKPEGLTVHPASGSQKRHLGQWFDVPLSGAFGYQWPCEAGYCAPFGP